MHDEAVGTGRNEVPRASGQGQASSVVNLIGGGWLSGLTTFQKAVGLSGMTLVVAFAFIALLNFLITQTNQDREKMYILLGKAIENAVETNKAQNEKLVQLNENIVRMTDGLGRMTAELREIRDANQVTQKMAKESADEQRRASNAMRDAIIELRKITKGMKPDTSGGT